MLPDGTELSSGAGQQNAIQSVTITECVNEQQELTLGSCCSNMLEAKLITPEGGVPIATGDELTVYKEDETGRRTKVGLFTAEKPTRPSANSLSITAYDRISWLDKDLTQWLVNINSWPVPLFQLADMVCEACGLELLNESIPNGNYRVQQFSADGITGRHIMRWIGEISGRFCRATPDGHIQFAWYEPIEYCSVGISASSGGKVWDDGEDALFIELTEAAIDSSTEGELQIASDQINAYATEEQVLTVNIMQTQFYYQNGLSFEDYQVAPIQKIQLQQNTEDVGTVYPDTADALNTYIVTGNQLLTASTGDELLPVAETLYEHLKDVTYTPCKVSIPMSLDIRPGHILQILDKNGREITAYVMTKTSAGLKTTLECTGSASRNSSTAVNNQTFKALTGKVLNLRTDVDGLKVENADTKGNLAKLDLRLGNISSDVQRQEETVGGLKTQLTQVEQTATGLSLRISSVEEKGVGKVQTGMGYTFDDNGLHIKKPGQQMENRLDHTGMTVERSGEVMLRADKDGVLATDVKVRNYLIIGSNSRLEDYEGGTGCFWVGG